MKLKYKNYFINHFVEATSIIIYNRKLKEGESTIKSIKGLPILSSAFSMDVEENTSKKFQLFILSFQVVDNLLGYCFHGFR